MTYHRALCNRWFSLNPDLEAASVWTHYDIKRREGLFVKERPNGAD
jgi:hypothetical protein